MTTSTSPVPSRSPHPLCREDIKGGHEISYLDKPSGIYDLNDMRKAYRQGWANHKTVFGNRIVLTEMVVTAALSYIAAMDEGDVDVSRSMLAELRRRLQSVSPEVDGVVA